MALRYVVCMAFGLIDSFIGSDTFTAQGRGFSSLSFRGECRKGSAVSAFVVVRLRSSRRYGSDDALRC